MLKELFDEFQKTDDLMTKIFSFLVDADEVSFIDASVIFSIIDLTYDNLAELAKKYNQAVIERQEKTKKHKKLSRMIMALITVCNVAGLFFFHPLLIVAILLWIVLILENYKYAKDKPFNYDDYKKLKAMSDSFGVAMDNCRTFLNKKINPVSFVLSDEIKELLKDFSEINVELYMLDITKANEMLEMFEKEMANNLEDDVNVGDVKTEIAEKEEEVSLKLVKKNKK